MNKLFFLVAAVVIFLINGCSKPGSTNTTPPVVDPCVGLAANYAADVKPIFNTTCSNSANCHGTGSVNSGGELTDYNKIFIKRGIIKGQINAGLMPKAGSLTAAEKNKIICWIDAGAPNN